MFNKRIRITIVKDLFLIFYLNHVVKKIAKKDKLPEKDRYNFAMKYIHKYHKDAHVIVDAYGKENIPEDLQGAMFMGNHQGKDDAICVFEALSDIPMSFVVDDARSHMFFFGPIVDMMKAKRIKFNDLKSQIKVYNEMAEEINQGRRFLIFPEAGYSDNRNILQYFNTPCFMPAIKSHCPIIPFCIYDSYKVYDKSQKKYNWLHVQVHILKPILYKEYKDLSKQDLAMLLKNRIEEKLNEIESNLEVK